MDLGRLRSFAEVAERGTVAAAATALGFTAPAVSQHLAKLEADLGAQLFDRAGRRLQLTDSGRALLPIALEMLDLETHARQAVSAPSDRPHFVVAGFASALAALVVPKLASMSDRMTVEVVESEDIDAMRDLSLGAVDLVLTQEYDGIAADRDQRFNFTPMISDRLRLVLPDDLAPSTTVDQLATADWLLNGSGTRCATATLQILQAQGIQPSVSATVADNDTLLALVAAGHGVTIVPELLLQGPCSGVTVAEQDLGVSRTIFAVGREVSANSIAPLIELLRP